ncbi:hypothetical protein [Allosphingosinicella vermicomposti]|uniref:hypothetical protein n=1 Tax=Allosphingosinicella vermicomposti TaxID=614671 RepID=UPI000D1088F1|nr:hypothetical protein [Allosphingosinicella vermicomposti]
MRLLLSASLLALAVTPAVAQEHSGHEGHESPPPPQPVQHQHEGHEMPQGHEGMDHRSHHGSTAMMQGALGPYPSSREASGTAWQPDASLHGGLHANAGDWMLMGHAQLNGVYSWQGGPRGGDKAFVSGMVMGMARREAGPGTLQLRAMLSPDPLMGKAGYPLHLATGETADGVTPLVDRQHPHDLFMELSASYSVKLGPDSSAYLYGGLPGEPAFGPPAFMHRMSIMDSPEAPITHHWLDSTHITFGVVTAGLVHKNVKIEASRFNGREPDEKRFNIETAPLDSTAARLSWNPTPNLALQASWADLKSPEQLQPDEDETRWSASAIYTRSFGEGKWWSTTAAWGRRDRDHGSLDALVLEGAVSLDDWTLFGRAEYTENNELLPKAGHHGDTYEVGKVSLGAIRDFQVAPNVKFGIGGLYARNFVPAGLETLYAGDPAGAMAFVRLKID